MLHSTGVAELTPGVIQQLQRKQPSRGDHPIPATPPGQYPRARVRLEETFRHLEPDASAGVSGRRNEFLRALTARFDDPEAARVMPLYDAFATAAINAELPPWFYMVWTSSLLVPIVKPGQDLAPGAEPDVRPVAVGEADLRAISSAVIRPVSDVFARILGPQQLAVGVPGGLSIIIHGIRITLEHRPDFVVVKIDLKNAFNSMRRSTALRRLRQHPELAHLIPFIHAMNAAESHLYVGGSRSRLFEGHDDRPGDSSTGWRQGGGESAASFSVGIHPEVTAMDDELRPWGGFARFIMDDGYAAGPSHAVFPAIARFLARVQEALDLEGAPGKLACYSPEYDLETCPHRAAIGAPIGSCDLRDRVEMRGRVVDWHVRGQARGIMVGGVPVGEPAYESEQLSTVADRYASYSHQTSDELRSFPHHMGAALHYCLAPDIDYWLRHVPPSATDEAARRLDATYISAVSAMGVDPDSEIPRDWLLLRRLRQPARYHGGGLRQRHALRRTAFTACVAEVVPQFLDVTTRDGTRPGFFPCLEEDLGAGSFGAGGSWLHTFVTSGRRTAFEFAGAWGAMAEDVRGRDVTGPLDEPAERGGCGVARHLQRQIQAQLDQVARDILHDDFMALPGDDQRRVAYLECGPLSTSWIGSWPSEQWMLSPRHYRETFALYFGISSPIVAEHGLVGTVFRDARGRPLVCDRHCSTLARAQMSDNGGHLLQSRSMERVIVQSVLGAGIAGRPQPSTIFAAVLPQRVRDSVTMTGRCVALCRTRCSQSRGFSARRVRHGVSGDTRRPSTSSSTLSASTTALLSTSVRLAQAVLSASCAREASSVVRRLSHETTCPTP